MTPRNVSEKMRKSKTRNEWSGGFVRLVVCLNPVNSKTDGWIFFEQSLLEVDNSWMCPALCFVAI
jgi:hypothetical protein